MHHLRTFVQASVRRNGYGEYDQWEAWSKISRCEVRPDIPVTDQVLALINEYYPPKDNHERHHVN